MDNDKLGQALRRAYEVVESKGKTHVLQTKEISRADREILTKNGWLQEIMRGWYLLVRPDINPGESSAWYANFWEFINLYLQHNYGKQYCLSVKDSLDLHIGKTSVPKQVVVIAKSGANTPIRLPFETSLLIYSGKDMIPEKKERIRGLYVMPLTFALCKASPSYFSKNQMDAEIALRLIKDPSELIHTIIKHNFVRASGRIVGAYIFLGKDEMATNIEEAVSAMGIPVNKLNPFEKEKPLFQGDTPKSSYQARIELMWSTYRAKIIPLMPNPPGLPANTKEYLKDIEAIHKHDAYHSLSIEGYHVSHELIEKVEQGIWNPDKDVLDKNALAARGYYEAFLEVEKSISGIINGDPPGKIAKKDLPIWFRKLFSPFVEARLFKLEDLWGYRRHQVYIRNSRHTPLSRENLLDAMDTFYHCLINEEHPAVRAILGHFFFVYIHPFMDGNGRISRFLMNAMLASGGYPWTVIKVDDRSKYFEALESASVSNDIVPFAKFIASVIQAPRV